MTAIIRDNSNHGYENVLIYQIDADPDDRDGILREARNAREADIGLLSDDERAAIEVLFCFKGDLLPVVDMRE